MKKIHIDELTEKAKDWWLDEFNTNEKEQLIIKTYIKKKGIKNKDVNW